VLQAEMAVSATTVDHSFSEQAIFENFLELWKFFRSQIPLVKEFTCT